jgi:hypothetical protein
VVEKFKCPRCGFEQSPAEICRSCRINIPKYIELQNKRRAVPGEGMKRQPKEEDEQKKTPSEPSEEIKKSASEKIRPPEKEYLSSGPPDIPETKDRIAVEDKAKDGIIGIGVLFERSWDIFKERFGTLIALYLIIPVFILVPTGIFIGISYLFSFISPDNRIVFIIAGSIVGAIAGIIAGCWGLGAFLFAVVDETLKIKDALEKGLQKLGAFFWLFSIIGYLIPGGFLLFIIPGVIFMVWFTFAQFILPNEDEKGMNAVLKSKEYVKGYWFDIFLRLFIIWLVSTGISTIPNLIGSFLSLLSNNLGLIFKGIGFIFSILFFPFEMIFICLIYKDLKSVKGDVSYKSSSGEKFKWIAIATLGYIVLPVVIIAILWASIVGSLFMLKDLMEYKRFI